MGKVVIFGLQDYAELAHYYLTKDTNHEVVGFCVNEGYLPASRMYKGLPVYGFEGVEKQLPPSEVDFFAPMAPTQMNRLRERVYEAIKGKGYSCISYVSSKATVMDNDIGENCFILEDNTLQPFTTIGDNVVLWSGNHIGHHGRIEDHVTITSHVVMSGHCHIGPNAFLGVNSTLRDGIKIGKGALIAMGAMLTKDAEPWGVYQGSPAKKADKRSDEINF